MNPEIMAMMQGLVSQIAGRGPQGLSPWSVREDCIAASLQTVRSLRARPEQMDMRAAGINRRGDTLVQGSYARRIGNIAIIPVIGPLVSRENWQFWSYDEIVRDIRIAVSMPDIAGIILDVDSPGGMVANVTAVPAAILEARKSKPVFAHVGGMGASAAYWVASAAEKVFADQTALVGSVGALIRYVDMEGILTRLGANVVEVIATQSPNKKLARDSAEGRAELQAIADDGAEMFIAGLMQNRNQTREMIIEKYGQGLVFTAGEAMQRGLIDQIACFEDVLAEMAGRPIAMTNAGPAPANSLSKTEKATMNKTIEELKAEFPETVAAIETNARSAGIEAERARLAAIDEHASGLSGHEELVKKLKADANVTPADAAIQILAAEKGKNAERLKGLQQLDNAAAGLGSLSLGASGSDSVPQTPEGWKAQYDATPSIQAEFPTADAYIATMKRKAA